ncbi:hypothetical protein ACFU9Y_04010 [Streptomyces sp. NPDC057621]|uniref:hypothetical protein n=1 Tax=Streptomyces sp. NPDC057621 TaxID=3346186 RepID=UPI0036A7D0EB
MALLFAPHAVTVLRAPDGFDAEGNSTTDWSTAQRAPKQGLVEPAASSENTENRDQVATAYTVWLPPGTSVAYRDRLEWNGLTLEVSGDPLEFGALTPLNHIRLTATRIRG